MKKTNYQIFSKYYWPLCKTSRRLQCGTNSFNFFFLILFFLPFSYALCILYSREEKMVRICRVCRGRADLQVSFTGQCRRKAKKPVGGPISVLIDYLFLFLFSFLEHMKKLKVRHKRTARFIKFWNFLKNKNPKKASTPKFSKKKNNKIIVDKNLRGGGTLEYTCDNFLFFKSSRKGQISLS